jgi:hypothetical protein
LAKGVKLVTEEKQEKSKEETKKKKPRKPEEALPSCRTAPSAEHARAQNEDEPCDDARGAE